ncbi:MAG: type I-E CRISPR-associated protein Cse2/CasB, partial [Plesiomonas sp.]
YALVAAAVARGQQTTNGRLSLGKAIANAFPEGSNSDQAKARLRRLLACDEVSEACLILRPLLSLIRSRVSTPLDYSGLLEDLRWFNQAGERVKARWAQQFYNKTVEEGV